ncbi:hypothetical protein [Polaribacter sp.]|uniref:hypothetical protein n=1 Tax=Polaribacter sp. TaxID=1920175 RepID=UPI0025E9CE17|nr:hypothetical protein [Polaribacter sp.]
MSTLFKISKILFVSLIIVLLASCNTQVNSKNQNQDPLKGVWKLDAFYTLANSDTIVKNYNKVQHKMYLNGHVLWNTDTDENDIDWSGYGTYSFKNDTITETLTSTSKSMKSDINTYVIPIDLNVNSYKQVNKYYRNDTVFKNIEIFTKID